MAPLRAVASVSPTDPPLDVSGMRSVITDTRGRLVEFHAAPPQFDAAMAPAGGARLETALRRRRPGHRRVQAGRARMDAARLRRRARRVAGSARRSARHHGARRGGGVPRQAHVVLRRRPVDTAEPHGADAPAPRCSSSPASSRPARRGTPRSSSRSSCARRNLKTNRANRRGANALTLVLFFGFVSGWLLRRAPHAGAGRRAGPVPDGDSASSCCRCGQVWVLYVAIEPYARRFWPDGLLGWTRLHVRSCSATRASATTCSSARSSGPRCS